MNTVKLNIILIIFLLISYSGNRIYAQLSHPEIDEEQYHELTIFVIRSVLPLNWESPSTLFKSYRNEITAKPLRKQKSMMGHTFVLLRSPLLADSIFAGMTYVSKKKQHKLVMKDKIGMGILGIYMEGRMQPHDELTQKMNYYASKDEVSFIRYRINGNAAQRVINFYNSYLLPIDDEHVKCNYYGGAFWPRFDYEGSGCSAFGFSCLDVAQILEEFPEWRKSVNIPMALIGGELNENRRIKIREIKRSKSWYPEEGISHIDFVPFEVFDPSAVFYWIRNQIELPDSLRKEGYSVIQDFGIPGIYADRTNVEINKDEPILIHRVEENLFIRHFYLKTGIVQPVRISAR